MSPRAAGRLERLGFTQVYDYIAGKADWLAAGLPTEGRHRPARVLDAADRDPPTCRPDETAAVASSRLQDADRDQAPVVDADGVVLGRFRVDPERQDGGALVEDVMEPGPATVRANADLGETTERMARHTVSSMLVTTPEGVLLGELVHQDGGK